VVARRRVLGDGVVDGGNVTIAADTVAHPRMSRINLDTEAT
jgi:hypothetical protein